MAVKAAINTLAVRSQFRVLPVEGSEVHPKSFVSNFWGALHLSFSKTGKDCEISLNTHFLLDFGDFDKSFSLGNAHASLALRSLNHVFIVHEALVLALTFIILEKLLNRLCLEKTYIQVTNEVSVLLLFVDKHQYLLCN